MPHSESQEMKCPRCKRFSLSRKKEETEPELQGGAVACGTCGYVLSPGEEVKFRLFESLKRYDR